MSKKFKVWLDSGASIHSKHEVIVSLEEIGLSDERWAAMTEKEQEDEMRQIAFEKADWGYVEVER